MFCSKTKELLSIYIDCQETQQGRFVIYDLKVLYSQISSYLRPGHNFSKFLAVLSAQRGQFTNLYSNKVSIFRSKGLSSQFPFN